MKDQEQVTLETFLEGKFKSLTKISEGSNYGTIYKALDQSNKIVAIKKMNEHIQDNGISSSSIREISILSSLNHPNIIKIIAFDILADKDLIYIVLEYIPLSVKNLIHKENNLQESRIQIIMKGLISGIDYLHQRNIIHRDIKPSNLLFDEETNLIKIIDFGLSRTIDCLDIYNTPKMVTLFYRAPEILLSSSSQKENNKYGKSIDIWSAGCIFAELFLKHPLFSSDCEIAQLYKIFQILGTPDENSWPNFTNYVHYSCKFPKWRKQNLKSVIGNAISDCALDLLEKMITSDPLKRISKKEALDHPFLKF